eukprot:scaffold17118_cov77-Skeletonema_dohrnii-CCMP3373.AAC.1
MDINHNNISKLLLPSRKRTLVFGERKAKFESRVKAYIGTQYVPIRIRFRVTVGDGLNGNVKNWVRRVEYVGTYAPIPYRMYVTTYGYLFSRSLPWSRSGLAVPMATRHKKRCGY